MGSLRSLKRDKNNEKKVEAKVALYKEVFEKFLDPSKRNPKEQEKYSVVMESIAKRTMHIPAKEELDKEAMLIRHLLRYK